MTLMDIVERLRKPVSKDDPYICTNIDTQPEIKYDLLRSQAADEIERLREALKPFAELGEKYLKDKDKSVQDNVDKWDFVVPFSDLVKAYAALQQKDAD